MVTRHFRESTVLISGIPASPRRKRTRPCQLSRLTPDWDRITCGLQEKDVNQGERCQSCLNACAENSLASFEGDIYNLVQIVTQSNATFKTVGARYHRLVYRLLATDRIR